MKNSSQRLTRWSFALQPFYFDVVHQPDYKHSNVDGLSRQCYHKPPPAEVVSGKPDALTELIIKRLKILSFFFAVQKSTIDFTVQCV